MLKFWSNCKLGVKLQSAFALVMLVFVAALVGVLAANAKIQALTALQTTTLIPARAQSNLILISGLRADDEGAYYLMDRRPVESAQYLAAYRHDLAAFRAHLEAATNLANNDTQRALIADIHKATDGPQGWDQVNEDAFYAKSRREARRGPAQLYVESPGVRLYSGKVSAQCCCPNGCELCRIR